MGSGGFIRVLNLTLAPMQILATVVAFGLGTTFDDATASLPAFLAFTRPARNLSALDQSAMVIPLSIYTGWVTVATFANASAFLHEYGVLDVVLTPAWWAVIMVTAVGAIAAGLSFRSGNVPFALTACWALVAILAANLTRQDHIEVVIACALMTAAQIGALVSSRRRHVAA